MHADAPTAPTDPATGAEQDLALLFTDVVDSTRLNEQVGDERARQLWAEHDRAARELLRRWRGREVGRGDGFFILFEACADALEFALDYHRALARLAVPFSARVGLHWGPVALRHNAAADVAGGATPYEVDGLALPTAARVMSAAAGGQTLLSAAALRQLPAAALEGRVHCTHGHWRLKGLEAPVELHEIGARDAALAPPPDSAKAYRVVWRDGQWVAAAALPNNLGAEPDRFVGRDADLHALANALDAGNRLVTLLGTGGIGKTRLAQRYARGWLGSWPGGAWFCDLSAARGLDGIVHAVAQALDLPLGRSDPVQQLTAALAGRDDCLLVLDNFEQVARHAAASLGVWLRALPRVRFLVTSREVLGLPGEHLLGLGPMSVPEAQALFTERMLAAGLDTALAPDDAAALPALVEMLDGMPLAIELAASRARVMAPADQLRRIGERFWLLAGRGGRLDRQATLRATLDWSWDLLSAAEQSALAQLSVFEGGFTLPAVEAVLDLADGVPAPWPADVLQSLVEKSLVQRLHARRFALLRSVQDYATERLAGLDPGAAARHWRYFAGLGEASATEQRGVELDNLVVACRRAASASQAPAADVDCAMAALGHAWAVLRLSGPFRAALELAEPLATREDLSPLQRARVLRVLGAAEDLLGRSEQALAHYTEGRTLAQRAGDQPLQAWFTCCAAVIDAAHGRAEPAHQALRGAMSLAHGDAEVEIVALNALGNLEMGRGRLREAQAHFERALPLAQGRRRWQGGLQGNLGALALMSGAAERALGHLQSALEIATELADRQWAGNAHCNLGLLFHEMGDHERARTELRAASEIAAAIGHRRLEATALCNLGLVEQAAGDAALASQAFRRAAQLAQDLRDPHLEAEFLGHLGEHLCRMRLGAEANDCFCRAQQLLGALDDPYASAVLHGRQALGLALLGEPDAAAQALARASAAAGSLPSALTGAELLRLLDRARAALSSRCS